MTYQGKPLEGTLVLLIEEDCFLAGYVGSVIFDAGAQVLGPARTPDEAVSLVRSLRILPLGVVVSTHLLCAEGNTLEPALARLGAPVLLLQQDCRSHLPLAQHYDRLIAPFAGYQIVDHLVGIRHRLPIIEPHLSHLQDR